MARSARPRSNSSPREAVRQRLLEWALPRPVHSGATTTAASFSPRVDRTDSSSIDLYYDNRKREQRPGRRRGRFLWPGQRPGVADRVPPRPRLWRADLPPARSPSRARAASRLPQTRQSAAQGQRCGRFAGHQPEHGVEGLSGAGDQGSHRWAARPGHVHLGHPQPGRAPRADRAPSLPTRLAGKGRHGGAGRERDGGAVHQRAAGFL